MASSQVIPVQTQLKLISINAKGLNLPEKRSQLLLTMKRNQADIIFIQETHFRTDSIPKLKNMNYPETYHSTTPSSKTRGIYTIGKKLPSPNY